MNKYKKLGKNFGLLTIGSFATTLLSYFLLPLYTAILTTEEYGTVDIINVTISLLFPILSLVISEAVMRFCYEAGIDKRQVFNIGFWITTAGCAVMFVLSPILFATPIQKYYLFFVVYFISQSYSSLLGQTAKGYGYVKEYAIGGVLHSAITIFSNILLLLGLKMGIEGYLCALIAGHVATCIYYLIVVKCWRQFISFKSIDKAIAKEMLKYSCPMILNGVSWWISTSSDRYMVTAFCGLSENGIYSVSSKIPTIITTISGLFMSAWNITVIEDFDVEKSKRFFSDIGDKIFTICIMVASGLIAFNQPFAHILYNQTYYSAWRITPILVVSSMLNCMSVFYGSLYTVTKKTKVLFYSTVAASVVNIIVNLLLIPYLGGVGAAIATTLSYAIILLIRILFSKNLMPLDMHWVRILISFALIVLQTVLSAFNTLPMIVCSFAVMIVVLAVNGKMIIELIKLSLNIIKRRTN